MASDPQTWAELKASIETWIVRDDYTTRIPEFIALAERRFNREVFHPDREATATLTTTAESVALPTDFWGVRSIWIDADPKTRLDQMSLGVLRETYASSATGRPGNYAITGGNVVFGPSPDASYSAKLDYWQTIPALGVSQATNWLLTDHPDLYLCGSLVEAFLANYDEARAAPWEQRTRDKIDSINRSGRRFATSGAPFRIRTRHVV